ncbi:hypothetical protein QTP86_028405 [Hemibagrus guttatus]|nr:hypothetical protein QTP86_028405 [Hemibagrus guttatus]
MMGRDAVDFPVAVVLPAAGSGERTGLATPKQFCTFLNRPLISFTIETFERISWVKSIVVVVAKESHDLMLSIVQQFHHTKVKVVDGGTTRHRSIFSGLQVLSESSEDPVLPRTKVVIIHDAVRPFVDEEFLLKITLAAKEQGASGAIRPLVSTVIATTSEGFLDHSLERTKYRASEMPQGFLYDVIYQAYQRCSEFDFEFGTECLHLALQYSGTSAKLIEGPPTLWKVTYKRDLAAAESIIKESLSLSACLISGAMAETVELSSRLQKNLESHHMTSGASLSETEEMVKVFEETKHALLYPVVIVWVQLCMSDEATDIRKNEELKAIMELSWKAKQGNVLLYSVQIIYSKVPELWERSVERLTEITESLIRDRNPVLIGQMLQA